MVENEGIMMKKMHPTNTVDKKMAKEQMLVKVMNTAKRGKESRVLLSRVKMGKRNAFEKSTKKLIAER